MADAMAIVAAVRGNSGNRSNNEHGSHNNSNHNTNNNSNNGSNGNPTMRALVNYLILEADLAEERAKRLRQQADAMARRFGFTTSTSSTRTIVAEAYEMNPDEMAPLDENGIPKYKGKKRGRKMKPRARKINPNRKKRKHTGYTLYMQEHYPTIKSANPDFASKDVITIVAKEWADLSPDAKTEWKSRAASIHNEDDGDDENGEDDDDEEEEDDDGNGGGDDDEDEGAAAAAAVAADEMDDDDDDPADDEDDEPIPPARTTKKSKR